MMPDILRAAALRDLNTFGINEFAERLVPVEPEQQLREALALADAQGWPGTVLGGGSNMISAGPLAGLVIAMRSRGRRVVSRDPGSAVTDGAARENGYPLVS